MESLNPNFYCAELAVQRDEQLFATATRVDVWLLLSYTSPFGRKAFEDAVIPSPVKEHLSAAARDITRSRIQLIKQNPRDSEGLIFFVALASEINPTLYRFELTSYEDLLNIDIRAVCSGEQRYEAYIEDEPLFLVCTHGSHDRCCARFGTPIYSQMATRSGIHVWQTSHLGGHRFAGNIVCLPHGVMYGRVAPADVTAIVAEQLRQSILLGKYRGRSCYDTTVQAADHFLRKHLQMFDLMGLRYLETIPVSDTESLVTFLSTTDGRQHELRIARDIGALHTFTSCGAAHESSVDQYRLLSHREL